MGVCDSGSLLRLEPSEGVTGAGEFAPKMAHSRDSWPEA